MDILTDKNFLIFAAQNYINPGCRDTEEFYEDIRRIKYIKKLITRYQESGNLKERLILNHLIVLSNVFLPEPLCRILFLKMEPQMGFLKPFLIMIGVMQTKIRNVRGTNLIDTEIIVMDNEIVKRLRAI